MSDTLGKISVDRMVAWDTYLAATKGLLGELYVVTERREWLKLEAKQRVFDARVERVCREHERTAA